MCDLKLVIWNKTEKKNKEILIENPLCFRTTNTIFTYLRENVVETHVLGYQTVILDFADDGSWMTVEVKDGVRE